MHSLCVEHSLRGLEIAPDEAARSVAMRITYSANTQYHHDPPSGWNRSALETNSRAWSEARIASMSGSAAG